MFDTLKECKSSIQHLALEGNFVDDECMKSIGEFIQQNETLELLNLANCNITSKGIIILAENISGNVTLKEINLVKNEGIDKESILSLKDIAQNTGVDLMHLDSTSLTTKEIGEVVKLLNLPIMLRTLPVISNSKSAAKVS